MFLHMSLPIRLEINSCSRTGMAKFTSPSFQRVDLMTAKNINICHSITFHRWPPVQLREWQSLLPAASNEYENKVFPRQRRRRKRSLWRWVFSESSTFGHNVDFAVWYARDYRRYTFQKNSDFISHSWNWDEPRFMDIQVDCTQFTHLKWYHQWWKQQHESSTLIQNV